jgi:putative endonuclease
LNQRQLGKEKEELACGYLRDKGYEIITCNYWCRGAELDIVAKDGEYLVFVEVKYRKDHSCGGSRYAVSPNKIRKIIQCARTYLYREGVPLDMPMRFDVIAIEGKKIWHFIHAFDADGWS